VKWEILTAVPLDHVALHTGYQPVASKALAHRHRLPPRDLEPVLQALVLKGVLKDEDLVGAAEMIRRSCLSVSVLTLAVSTKRSGPDDAPGLLRSFRYHRAASLARASAFTARATSAELERIPFTLQHSLHD
jgi:hypothetical protein